MIPLYDLSEDHEHEWVLIGTAAYGSERSFKVYQCQKCSCWAKERLEPTGEEELCRGEIVDSPSVDSTNESDDIDDV